MRAVIFGFLVILPLWAQLTVEINAENLENYWSTLGAAWIRALNAVPLLKQLYVLFLEVVSFRNSGFSKDFISYQNILDLVAVLATVIYCSIRIAHPFGAYLNPELV